MANPTTFARRCNRLFITQSATVAANTSGPLSPPFKLDDGQPKCRLLYGIVTTGTVTDAAIVLEQDGQRITPNNGIPLEVVADLSPPEFIERRAQLIVDPGQNFAPELRNETGSAATWEIVWLFERIEDASK